MRYLSPLRYPGGKAKIAPLLSRIIASQTDRPSIYAEPFAGGAGAAFILLADDVVERVALNDLNPGIASFWRALLEETERLVAAVETAELSLATWHRQREIYLDEQSEPFDLGFAAFYLNRTNRSGILGARPIGGLEQTGRWKIDARFNRIDLIGRIRFIATFKDRVSVSQLDGRTFIRGLGEREGRGVFFYVDPPYLKQGEDLYLAAMSYRDHLELAATLNGSVSPWAVTYDKDDRVPDELYEGLPCAEFTISHTAARQHVGDEYLVVPKSLKVPALEGFGPRPGTWLRGRSPEDMTSSSHGAGHA